MTGLRWWIRILAVLVPDRHRSQWAEGWLGELEDVARARGLRTAVRLGRGAFRDALAVRREIHRGAPASGVMSMGVTWLDVKLAIRLLIRYPGLTTIGVVGMAVGIAIAAGAFGILYTFIDPALPLDEGDRIVVLQNWDASAHRVDRRTVHELSEWRDGLQSVQDVGAFHQVSRNLIAEGAQPETVRIAAMSAAGFRVARVQPLMGRVLVPADEGEGATAVLVIGHEPWRTRFGSDPSIVGRTVHLGDVPYVIVGVMPDGFAFPVSHQYWMPLRLDASRYERRAGPDLTMFGRLAPGATLESANAELALVGQRAAAAMPQTHAQLRPRILPYTYPFFDIDSPAIAWLVHLLQFLITLLLVIVCVNVAILVYARTATRAAEIAVRTALGASRGRIVSQLFIEALALSAVAALVGLVMAEAGLKQIHAAMLRGYAALPFWWNFGLSIGNVVYVVGLAVLAAAIVGIVPALKATGPRMQGRLKSMSAGSGGMQLGRLWTFMIAGQVALAVALLPAAVYHTWDSLRTGMADPGFAAEQYLTTQLLMDPSQDGPGARTSSHSALRYGQRHAELVERLHSEPDVAAVTFSTAVPGEEATVWIEVEGIRSPTAEEAQRASGYAVRVGSGAGHEVRMNRVDAGYFGAFDVPPLAGRGFRPADANPTANTVIVNRSFADQLAGGSSVIGRQLRYIGRTNDAAPEHVEFGRWYEIVGVVPDFPNAVQSQLVPRKVYHATTASAVAPVQMSLRLRTDPVSFAGRLREIAAAVDPRLQLRDLMSMDDAVRRDQAMLRLVAAVLAALTAAVLLLSSAGVYAMMSFTITQRRREIGIRTALGADQRQILAGIFSRALAQLAAGALIGMLAAILLEAASDGDLLEGHGRIVLPIVAIFMMLVGVLAALGPARKGLQIQPTEALRE